MRLRWPGRRAVLRRAALVCLATAWFATATKMETRRLAEVLPGGAGASPLADSSQLLEDVRRLSAPEMEGRRVGTEGSARARAYIVQRLREEKAQPLGGAYEHPFDFVHTSIKALWRRDRPLRVPFHGTNILALVPGARPGPALVVSAHYDHLGIR